MASHISQFGQVFPEVIGVVRQQFKIKNYWQQMCCLSFCMAQGSPGEGRINVVRQGIGKFFVRSSHSLHFCDTGKVLFWKTGTPTEGVLCVYC